MADYCSYKKARKLDNSLRLLIHNPKKLFKPYVKPGMRVMDFGCGAGFASIGMAHLVGKDGKVLSVDMQSEMLDMVKARIKQDGLEEIISTHQCDTDSLNVDGMFDFVNAFWVVHEVPDSKSFLQEVYSHLNPGGRLLIAEPMFHVTGKGFKQLIKLAEDVGFSVDSMPRLLLCMSVVLIKK
jgi:ubiquinone/menaquinone biosynthesis C-methylase UbiE